MSVRISPSLNASNQGKLQGNLHEAVKDFFITAEANQFLGVPHDYKEELDKDHGRLSLLEVRRYWITEKLCTLPNIQDWKGLRRIGMMERECQQGDIKTVERRYFINSILRRQSPLLTLCVGTGVLKILYIGGWMSCWVMMQAAFVKATARPS